LCDLQKDFDCAEIQLMLFKIVCGKNLFGSRRDDVTGDWKRWHNVEFNELYFLANVLLENISRGTR